VKSKVVNQHSPVYSQDGRILGFRKSKHLVPPINRFIMNESMGNGQQDIPAFHNKFFWTLRLGLILVLVSIPSLAILSFRGTYPVLARLPPLFWGSWAVFSIWIILDKGLPHVIGQRKDILGPVWLFLGLTNLVGAVIRLCSP
jgi:hypothetical protein